MDWHDKDWYSGPAGYKTWATWHDKTYPTDFQKACNDSRQRQELGRAEIDARIAFNTKIKAQSDKAKIVESEPFKQTPVKE